MSLYSENIINDSNNIINDSNNIINDPIQDISLIILVLMIVVIIIFWIKKKRDNLLKQKYELEKKTKKCDSNIDDIKKLICNTCAIENNGHQFITYREPCMYGEKYTYCKIVD